MESNNSTCRSHNDPTNSKVGRLLAEREIELTGEELAKRWIGDGYEEKSLRDLADRFNKQLLRLALESKADNLLSGEVENLYRLLTADDVSGGERTQARRKLENQGIDVDSLENDFVSHRAIHTYLTKYRRVEKKSNQEPVSSGIERIQRLQERVVSVSENLLATLRSSNHLSIGEFTVIVNIQVTCEECGAYHELTSLLREGGCSCQSD